MHRHKVRSRTEDVRSSSELSTRCQSFLQEAATRPHSLLRRHFPQEHGGTISSSRYTSRVSELSAHLHIQVQRAPGEAVGQGSGPTPRPQPGAVRPSCPPTLVPHRPHPRRAGLYGELLKGPRFHDTVSDLSLNKPKLRSNQETEPWLTRGTLEPKQRPQREDRDRPHPDRPCNHVGAPTLPRTSPLPTGPLTPSEDTTPFSAHRGPYGH